MPRMKLKPVFGITLLSSLSSHLFAVAISLSVPTTDVVQATSVNCQWSANATDPATFALVMQFSDATLAVMSVQRGNAKTGSVPNIKNVAHPGMHRLAAYADPFNSASQPFTLSPAFNVVNPTISLSVPTTDVVAGTSVDCEWSASATDPTTFALVMQFSNATSQFSQTAAVTTVQRGTATNGTVPNIKNVANPGMHRLAAYVDPFDSGSPPFAVSPAFNVVNVASASTYAASAQIYSSLYADVS
ncbi:hypothetical protein DFH09DRAFT_1215028, partial [Mycena vulgaris]